jgi:hypothetical protein
MITKLQEVFLNWKAMTRFQFDEYMLNNIDSLLREEKEQLMDAYNSCMTKGQSGEFIVNVEDYESSSRWWEMVYEEDKPIQSLSQSTLF